MGLTKQYCVTRRNTSSGIDELRKIPHDRRRLCRFTGQIRRSDVKREGNGVNTLVNLIRIIRYTLI
jgi:hypothetical protein